MEKYKRVKVLGKGSFGHAVLVTVAKDPSKQYVVVRHPPITARPRASDGESRRSTKSVSTTSADPAPVHRPNRKR
jgi:glycerol-3-phosphate dehydrogenase